MPVTAEKTSLRIDRITVGTRHRREMGDIESLAQSMASIGLLHAPVVNDSHELIVGGRRLAAAIHLGWKTIPVTIARNLDDIDKALRAERDENTCRKDFTPSEAVNVAKSIESIAKPAAEQRMKSGKPSSDSYQGGNGRVKAIAAKSVGMSEDRLRKAESVVDAAKQDPEHFGDLPAKMDSGGKVEPVFQEAQDRAEKLPEQERPAAISQRPKKTGGQIWCKWICDLLSVANSTRDNGGVIALVKSWAPGEIEEYIATLKDLRESMDEWIKTLEAKCHKKHG